MLTSITYPNCGHIGVGVAATLPRTMTCSACGTRAAVRDGTPARSPSVAREERDAERRAQARLQTGGERLGLFVQTAGERSAADTPIRALSEV